MKRYLINILTFIALYSCKQGAVVDYVILSGTVINPKKDAYITIRESKKQVEIKKIPVNQDGTFLDTLYVNPGIYKIYTFTNVTNAYMNKGDMVVLKESGTGRKDFAINYSGSNAGFNNYLWYKSKKWVEYYKSREDYLKLNEEEFLNVLNIKQKDLEDKLKVIKDLPKDILKKEMRDLSYLKLLRMMGYKSGKMNLDTNFKASLKFNKGINEIKLNDTKLYHYSQSYRSALMNFIYAKSQKSGTSIGEEIMSSIDNEYIRNEELHKYIAKALRYETDKQAHYNRFMRLSTNSLHKEEITALYNSLKALDPGQPSPKFVNYENYNGSTTSLEDLKGKYVYIDIWATWCGPCKAQIPFLKQVEKKYHSKNITFVSISTDKQKDKQKWKDMVKEKELGGVQLITDNDFDTSFISDYKIRGIPRFILLDPNGKIVTANAPRPSDKELIDLFSELNI